MADIRLQAVEGQDDPVLSAQLPAQVLRIAEPGGQNFVVAIEQVGHAALGDGHAAITQDRVDLRHRAMIAVAQGADHCHHVEAGLLLSQRQGAFGLRAVGLPHEFPPWSTVHRWFLRLSASGVFERLAHALTMDDRERAGREASPTGSVMDAQAARSGGVGVDGQCGYDPARRVVGRNRHALTDTDGRLPIAAVSPANLHDSHGGVALLRASRDLWPFLAHCFADRAYRGERVSTATAITIEIVAPDEGQKGFAVQPRRWVIERTFGWISRCRRLARDHEATASSALAFFVLAAAMVLVRRLAREL